MSYQVLARKWRPRNFQEMAGQEHVLRMLTNALSQQRLHHAYLFTGTRGVGKTSLARILARCLNCETGITATPCGQCSTCLSIEEGKFLDLIEVDAASRTKVEDTRELLENIQYAPSQGRYKIYLIDEVHMLSGHSFNALLKTLEEPPAHVIFILATTDPKKLPITILSRCLQFNLKRVTPEQITQQLQKICDAEKISYDHPGLQLVAQAADGSMRDALSILDQTIAYCGGKITTIETQQLLGSIEQTSLLRLLHALAEGNGKKLITEIAELAQLAPDFSRVLEEILSILHQITLAQTVDESLAASAIMSLAKQWKPEETQLYYQIALIGRRDLSLAPDPLIGFEMVMLRMLAFRPEPIQTSTKPQLSFPASNTESSRGGTTANQSAHWADIINQLELSGMALALAANCTLENLSEDKIVLALSKTHAPMLNQKSQERITEALSHYFKKTMKIEIKLADEKLNSPAKQKQEAQQAKQANAANAIQNDSQVQKIMTMFDATVDMNTVKPVD
jgi:DNA polymerase-3 subunit gamma/tau